MTSKRTPAQIQQDHRARREFIRGNLRRAMVSCWVCARKESMYGQPVVVATANLLSENEIRLREALDHFSKEKPHLLPRDTDVPIAQFFVDRRSGITHKIAVDGVVNPVPQEMQGVKTVGEFLDKFLENGYTGDIIDLPYALQFLLNTPPEYEEPKKTKK